MATLSRMMKKAASSVIPVGNRTPRTRNYTSVFFFTPLKNSTSGTNTIFRQEVFRTTSIPTYRHHLTTLTNDSDRHDLLRLTQSEIDRGEKEFDDLEVAEIPIEFPFKMEDNRGELLVTLTREYQGEEIKLTADAPKVCHADIKKEVKSLQRNSVEMFVSVEKKNKPAFKINIVTEADGFRIMSISLENPNASYEDTALKGSRELRELDVDLRAYLEIRGITPSLTKFLANYLASKEQKNYISSLRNLKNFIAN